MTFFSQHLVSTQSETHIKVKSKDACKLQKYNYQNGTFSCPKQIQLWKGNSKKTSEFSKFGYTNPFPIESKPNLRELKTGTEVFLDNENQRFNKKIYCSSLPKSKNIFSNLEYKREDYDEITRQMKVNSKARKVN